LIAGNTIIELNEIRSTLYSVIFLQVTDLFGIEILICTRVLLGNI